MADGRVDLGAPADGGVRLVLGTVVDLAGVTRAEAVPRERLPAFVDVGMGASPSSTGRRVTWRERSRTSTATSGW